MGKQLAERERFYVEDFLTYSRTRCFLIGVLAGCSLMALAWWTVANARRSKVDECITELVLAATLNMKLDSAIKNITQESAARDAAQRIDRVLRHRGESAVRLTHGGN
jgi:hypothetical protein